MAKKKKIEFHLFTIADFEKEEICLRENHKKGWKFIKFYYPGIYVFEKCEPEDVIYKLDFNDEGRKNKQEYIQMFNDCGWEYLFDVNGWSYFKKSAILALGNEEIFSDMESKLEMMQRVVKKRVLPLGIVFILILLPQLFIQYVEVISNEKADSTFHMLMLTFYLTMFLLYVIMFANFGIKFYRFKSRQEK